MEKRKLKLPLKDSFAHLCSFVGTMLEGLQILASGKQEVTQGVTFTIPSTGWSTDSSVPDYPNYIDITVSGLLSSDIVAVDVLPTSCKAAGAANFCSTESYNGKFRLRAEHVPSTPISAQYHITSTVEYTTAETEE